MSYLFKHLTMTNFSIKTALLAFLFIVLCSNVFAQLNEDDRMKIRLNFSSSSGISRQLLVTADSNATPGIDFGYDAESFENHPDDMYWIIDDRNFLIQGIDLINENSVLPLGLHTSIDGMITILVNELINIPEALGVVIFDKEANTYHNIKDNSGFSIDLPAGSYLDRFELRFLDNNQIPDDGDDSSGIEIDIDIDTIVDVDIDIETDIDIDIDADINLQFFNNTKQIAIDNPASIPVTSVALYSFSGQLQAQYNNVQVAPKTNIQTNNINTGQYILVVHTASGTTSKKILVN